VTPDSLLAQTRAVFFDFDGVLAETENAHVAGWQRSFERMGLSLGDAVCARAAEEDDQVFICSIAADKNWTECDINGLVAHKQRLTLAMLSVGTWLYPGARAVVSALAKTHRLGVVTGTWRENARTVLAAAGILDLFAILVAKEDVPARKPDPACYAKALERAGLEPTQALALEDSPSGVAAARSAGIRVLAIGHRRGPGEWHADAPYVPSLAELLPLLQPSYPP
jgi:HAD superfamily hydrolase (TIGR01509 family)